MAKTKTGLIVTLGLLYKSYGGWKSLLSSEYFYIAGVMTALCWRLAYNGAWSDLARSVLPTLSGFSIAAYAIFFAVIDENTRAALRTPSPDLENRSPLLILASSISHAVVIQLSGLLMAVIYFAKPFPFIPGYRLAGMSLNWAVSSVGLFVTLYGMVLVVASILSIFRILEIQSRVAAKKSA